jgi:hypothetical protein
MIAAFVLAIGLAKAKIETNSPLHCDLFGIAIVEFVLEAIFAWHVI